MAGIGIVILSGEAATIEGGWMAGTALACIEAPVASRRRLIGAIPHDIPHLQRPSRHGLPPYPRLSIGMDGSPSYAHGI